MIKLGRSIVAVSVGASLLLTQSISAEELTPTSYAGINGFGQAANGLFNYWDASYDGVGDTSTDGAPLSGGRGDLTDGVVADQSWRASENDQGTGPYVGWLDVNPTVTFEFDGPVVLDTVRVHVDDANNNGAVAPPASITVAGGNLSHEHLVDDPATSDPFWVEIDVSGMGMTDDTLSLTFNRSNRWVFVSEVSFSGSAIGGPVPEPASGLALLATGMVLMPRRRRILGNR